jgi:hypothetical protein
MPLLSAFQQVIKQPQSQRLTLMIHRDKGKEPSFFNNKNIREMAADRNFGKGDNLGTWPGERDAAKSR